MDTGNTITIQITVWSPSVSRLYQLPAAESHRKTKNQSKISDHS